MVQQDAALLQYSWLPGRDSWSPPWEKAIPVSGAQDMDLADPGTFFAFFQEGRRSVRNVITMHRLQDGSLIKMAQLPVSDRPVVAGCAEDSSTVLILLGEDSPQLMR